MKKMQKKAPEVGKTFLMRGKKFRLFHFPSEVAEGGIKKVLALLEKAGASQEYPPDPEWWLEEFAHSFDCCHYPHDYFGIGMAVEEEGKIFRLAGGVKVESMPVERMKGWELEDWLWIAPVK